MPFPFWTKLTFERTFAKAFGVAYLRWKYLARFNFGVVYLPPANEVAGRSCFQILSVFFILFTKGGEGPLWSLPGPIQTCSPRDPLPHLTIQWATDHTGTPLPGPFRHVQTWTSPYRTPPLEHGTICSLGPRHAGTLNSYPQPHPLDWLKRGWLTFDRKAFLSVLLSGVVRNTISLLCWYMYQEMRYGLWLVFVVFVFVWNNSTLQFGGSSLQISFVQFKINYFMYHYPQPRKSCLHWGLGYNDFF